MHGIDEVRYHICLAAWTSSGQRGDDIKGIQAIDQRQE